MDRFLGVDRTFSIEVDDYYMYSYLIITLNSTRCFKVSEQYLRFKPKLPHLSTDPPYK